MPPGPTPAFSLRGTWRTADETHDYIHAQGFACQACGHRHLPAEGAFRCLRCACPSTAPTLTEFLAMRTVQFVGEIVAMLPDGSVLEMLPVKEPQPKAVH